MTMMTMDALDVAIATLSRTVDAVDAAFAAHNKAVLDEENRRTDWAAPAKLADVARKIADLTATVNAQANAIKAAPVAESPTSGEPTDPPA
jgi:hypothetical protein